MTGMQCEWLRSIHESRKKTIWPWGTKTKFGKKFVNKFRVNGRWEIPFDKDNWGEILKNPNNGKWSYKNVRGNFH